MSLKHELATAQAAVSAVSPMGAAQVGVSTFPGLSGFFKNEAVHI